MSAGKPFDIGHASALWELWRRQVGSRDAAAEAAWRRDVAGWVRRAHELAPADLARLGELVERGPARVAGRPRVDICPSLLWQYAGRFITREQALRWIVAERKGARFTEENLKNAQQPLDRAMKARGWVRRKPLPTPQHSEAEGELLRRLYNREWGNEGERRRLLAELRRLDTSRHGPPR